MMSFGRKMVGGSAKHITPFISFKIRQFSSRTSNGGKIIIKADIPLWSDVASGWIEHQGNRGCMILGEAKVNATLRAWTPSANRFAI